MPTHHMTTCKHMPTHSRTSFTPVLACCFVFSIIRLYTAQRSSKCIRCIETYPIHCSEAAMPNGIMVLRWWIHMRPNETSIVVAHWMLDLFEDRLLVPACQALQLQIVTECTAAQDHRLQHVQWPESINDNITAENISQSGDDIRHCHRDGGDLQLHDTVLHIVELQLMHDSDRPGQQSHSACSSHCDAVAEVHEFEAVTVKHPWQCSH